MRIAVYTIALNEEQHVQQWADSCTDLEGTHMSDPEWYNIWE